MSLTIKAVLKKVGEQDEIRRFSVDTDVSANYGYLLQKISQTFPNLKGGSFSLFWKDNENDMISFSSDDELLDALGFVGDGIFRIYIKADSPVPPSNQTPAGPEHFGVVCDGCEGKVFGKRFKCQQCPNYDLCSSCRGTGLHGHHNFSEIEIPSFQPPSCFMNNWNIPAFPFGMPNFGRHQFGGCERKHGCRKQTSNAQKTETENAKEPETAAADVEKDESEQMAEHLKNVGKTVAAFLQPLGIDMEIDVEKDKENENGWSWSLRGRCGETMDDGRKKDDNRAEQTETVQTDDSFKSSEIGVEKVKAADATQQNKSESGDWMLIQENEESIPHPDGSACNEQFNASVPDSKIIEALETLKGMGFNDEGGWLTALAAAHEGDVNLALDAIHADRNQ